MLESTGYGLQNEGLQVTGYGSRVTGYRLRILEVYGTGIRV